MQTSTITIINAIANLAATLPLDEQREARAYLRKIALQRTGMAGFFGFRIPRRPRVEVKKRRRAPTVTERRTAFKMRRSGVPAHEVEQFFNAKSIKMTRNRQSRDDGARP